MEKLSIEAMATFCKKKGFVYPSAEIYGGLAGFWDFGHLGVELKNNIKNEWWNYHVKQREDIMGIDGSIITHPKVWEASGHVENFEDVMLTCSKCNEKTRADHLIEEKLKTNVEGRSVDEINKIIKKNNLKCPKCNSDFKELKKFSLMLKTSIGPLEDKSSISYLRPETAQLIFANFKLVSDNARLKLPFGIAQIGKGFRNEISPRDFLFRCREFEMMEIEYFVHPDKAEKCPSIKEVENEELNFLTSEMQQKKQEPKEMKVKDALKKKLVSEWHAYWLATEQKWFTDLGAKPENFRVRQHLKEEKSHYATDTWDLEYNFPFGWKELQGIANRTDFDLKQHMKFSGNDLSIFDEETKKKIIPYVIAEPSQGVERAFLVFMFDSYTYDKKRGNAVLKLHPKLAPVKVGIFPLVNKLDNEAKKVYDLLKSDFNSIFDKSGSIGRRYARADEIGIPYCITIDFDSLKDKKVTVRNRNDTKQIRVKINDLKETMGKLIDNP
ncbi:glycine--tRNA ligase [Candidatus Woesearchaeota archaeon]|nr:glycine--tRNA ligase [Candidatus Woesearchaeota archaeon]|tara:strand:+ start:366 stop:1856 length:1491 start_codon:yes stop_codon:yes gene_type:complete